MAIDPLLSATTEEKKLRAYRETTQHILFVQKMLMSCQIELMRRAVTHDQSKLKEPEFSMFVEHTDKLKDSVYGSEEYFANLETMKTQGLKSHYQDNLHHPEHFSGGIKDMTLIDLIEQMCDMYCACQRHSTGNIYESIKINKKRFGMSDDLEQIFVNTANWMRNEFEGLEVQSDIKNQYIR